MSTYIQAEKISNAYTTRQVEGMSTKTGRDRAARDRMAKILHNEEYYSNVTSQGESRQVLRRESLLHVKRTRQTLAAEARRKGRTNLRKRVANVS